MTTPHPTEQHVRYDANDIDRLEAHVGIQAGNLTIAGGADKLIDADIVCSEEAWQPKVDYAVEGRTGRLSMQQSNFTDAGIRFFQRRQNDWNVGFSSRIPTGLTVASDATKSNLDLSQMRLADFDFQSNAGTADLTLTGTHPDLQSYFIEANATRLNARIHGSFPKLKLLDFELNAVKMTLDLVGDWTHSHSVSIEANAGWIKLLLPSQVGVKVFAQTTMTMLRHSGLRKGDGALVNEAYGTSPITLTIDIEANVARVEIEVTDKIPVTV